MASGREPDPLPVEATKTGAGGGSSAMSLAGPGQTGRFVFVDGLRGLAALGIVVFHIWWYEPEPYPVLGTEPTVIDDLFLRIRGGVQVLLVISGFVIAYTMRNTWVTPREIGNFLVRRIVRLVPAYWFAIFFVILVDGLCRHWGGLASPFEGHLSLSRISAHLTFLQDVTGHDPLGAGMWTICIEVQFYFVAIIGWGMAQNLYPRPDRSQPRPSPIGLILVFAPLAFISLLHWRTLDSTAPWVTHFLWMFFLGMSTWWALDKNLSLDCYAVIVIIGVVELLFDPEWRYENVVALSSALAIFTAGRLGGLYSTLDWPWLQYLGKISYSLYLIHFPICHLLTTVSWNWFGDSPTALQASMILLSSLAASIIAAHWVYVLVEAPSARWSARLKRTGGS